MKKPLIMSIGLVLLLSAAGLVLWCLKSPPVQRLVTLSDGSTLTFQGVSYGTNQSFTPGDGWHKPRALLAQNGTLSNILNRWGMTVPRRVTYRTTYFSMASWFTWREGNSVRGSRPNFYGLIIDNNGYASDARGPDPVGYGPSQKERYLLCDTPYFPRRDKSFRLQFVHRTNNQYVKVAEFDVRNPVPGPFPKWKPEPLPIKRRDGDLEFTMTEFVVRLGSPLGPECPFGSNSLFSQARFRVTKSDQPTDHWIPISYEMTDATGNWVERPLRQAPAAASNLRATALSPDDAGMTVLRPCLWPTEPAWKVRVEFARPPEASFSAEELWTLKDLPVPAAPSTANWNQPNPAIQNTLNLNLATNIQGVHLTLVNIVSQNIPLAEQPEGLRSVVLEFRAAPAPQSLHLSIVEARDNRGDRGHPERGVVEHH